MIILLSSELQIHGKDRRVIAQGWTAFPTGQNIGGSVSGSNDTGDTTSFSITFNGTSISLYIIRSLLAGTNIPVSSTVSIDGAQVWDVPIEHGDNATLLVEEQWYTTPILDDTTHTISITNFPHNFTFDYGIITVGSKTPLDGELLIVDDNDTNMVYHPSESWEHFTHTPTVPVPGPRGLLQSLPYNGGTKQMNSSTEDAPWVKFTFTGTSVYVYGILDGSRTGSESLALSIGLDDHSSLHVYHPAAQTQSNFLWFSTSQLSQANHTLMINISQHNNNINFVLDYILYSPSFHFIAPDSGSSPMTPSQSSGPSSNGGSGSQSRTTPVPTIVGAVVGGIVTLALICVALLFRKHILASIRSSSRGLLSRKNKPQSQPAQDPAYNNGILAGFSMDDTPLGMPLGISPFLLPPSILHKPPPPVARRASTLTQPTVGNDPDIEYEQPSTRNWGGLRLNQDHEITPSDSDVAVMSPTPLQPQNPTETHLNARLRQLQELTLDIQREIVESISGAQRGVGSTLAGAGPMTGAVENDAHTTQPGSMLPPAYNYAEEAKSDNIRRFLEAASGSQ